MKRNDVLTELKQQKEYKRIIVDNFVRIISALRRVFGSHDPLFPEDTVLDERN